MEKRRAALSSVRAAAEELLGHAGDEQAEAAKGISYGSCSCVLCALITGTVGSL